MAVTVLLRSPQKGEGWSGATLGSSWGGLGMDWRPQRIVAVYRVPWQEFTRQTSVGVSDRVIGISFRKGWGWGWEMESMPKNKKSFPG